MIFNTKEKNSENYSREPVIYNENESNAFFSKKGFIVEIDKDIPELGEFHFVPQGFTHNSGISPDFKKREYMVSMIKSLIEGWEEFVKYREEHPESSLAFIHVLNGITNERFAKFIVKNFGASISGEYEDGRNKLFISLDGISDKIKLFKERYKEFIEK